MAPLVCRGTVGTEFSETDEHKWGGVWVSVVGVPSSSTNHWRWTGNESLIELILCNFFNGTIHFLTFTVLNVIYDCMQLLTLLTTNATKINSLETKNISVLNQSAALRL